MQRETTWWRNLGGLLAALVLALVVTAPTISMAHCVCRDTASEPSAHAETVKAAQSDNSGDDRSPCKAACCVSGHCHHAGSMVDAPVAMFSTPTPVAAEHAMTTTHRLASRAISNLDRPPRA
jgi:hypothetical protein